MLVVPLLLPQLGYLTHGVPTPGQFEYQPHKSGNRLAAHNLKLRSDRPNLAHPETVGIRKVDVQASAPAPEVPQLAHDAA